MPKSDTIRFHHMLDAAREAVSFAAGCSRADLDSNRMLNLSLVRLVEIIGEAAGRVSPEAQKSYPQIAWPEIVGMRHRLAHGYDAIDLDIVWEVVNGDLPKLIVQLEALLD